MKIILASQSKRRIRILKECGIKFVTRPADVDEHFDHSKSLKKNILINAQLKAKAIANQYKTGMVIGADTAVEFNGKLLGKPISIKEADSFLKMFSGNSLNVFTAICVINSETNKSASKVTTTKVSVKEMSKKMRSEILEKIDPLDRAGGFSIEGVATYIFDNIKGSFYNVLGLPPQTLYELFEKLGVDLLDLDND